MGYTLGWAKPKALDLRLVGGWVVQATCSPTPPLIPYEPVLPHCPGERQDQLFCCCNWWGTGPTLCSTQTSIRTQMIAQTKDVPMAFSGNMGQGHRPRLPLCCRVMSTDMSLIGSMWQGFSMASGGNTGYSYQAVLKLFTISSSASLHSAQALCFPFSTITIPHTCLSHRGAPSPH